MLRHLVLFVRDPALGQGKRRLAREIGDLAAVRFERLMIARLLRSLAGDQRWHLRIAVTPDRAAATPGIGAGGSGSFPRAGAISVCACAAH